MSQIEMSAPLSVMDNGGRLVNFGWARSPLYIYDSSRSWGTSRRFIASDRYIIISPSHLVCLEIMDSGILGYAGISIVSLLEKKRSSHSYITPFPMGGYGMPDASDSGAVRISRKNVLIEFISMDSGARILKVEIGRAHV